MSTTIQKVFGGIAGAAALNLVHQFVASVDKDAPRLDKVSEEAITKGMENVGITPPSESTVHGMALAGDIIGNTSFYSSIAKGGDKFLILRGIIYGLIAGASALALPEKMGLNDKPVTRTTKTKLMTLGWYTVGGLVTALTIRALRKK